MTNRQPQNPASLQDLEDIGIESTIAHLPRISVARRDVVDASPLGIVEVDLDRKIRYANAAALRILGASDYEGLYLDSAFPDPASQETLQRQIEERRAGIIGNYRIVARRLSDNRPVPIEITGLPVADAFGRVVGAIGLFRSLEQQVLANRIDKLNREIDNGNQLLNALGGVLHDAFPFDRMSVSRFSADHRHVNSFFVYGQQGNRVNQKRWWPLTEAQRAWFNMPGTRVFGDLHALLETDVWRDFRDEPAVQEIVRAGIHSLLRKVVRRGGALLGSITLMSKEVDGFTEDQRVIFDQLPIDATVIEALQYGDRMHMTQRLHIIKALNRCTTERAACRVLADELVKLFAWSHVSIFRVDKAAGRIRMVAQNWEKSERIELPDGYEQPIAVGLLGRVIATRQLQNVGNVSSDPDFVGGVSSAEVKSELCVPIAAGDDGAVRWIINAEDLRENAFATDECAALEELAGEVGGLMQRISQVYFLTQCFNRASDPILVTDAHLKINKANHAAAEMLAFRSGREVTGNLCDFFADSGVLPRLTASGAGNLGEFVMKRLGELAENPNVATSTVPVFLSRQDFPEGLGGSIFVARDTRHIRRAVELELLERAAYEVAVETSAPLAMAIAELDRLASTDSALAGSLAKVLRRLGRVRHGYTKLAMFNPNARTSSGDLSTIDLGTELAAVVESLTDAERALIRVTNDPEARPTRGNHFQIGIMLESLLSSLIRSAPEEQPVEASVAADGAYVEVRLCGFPAVVDLDEIVVRERSQTLGELQIASPLIDDFMRVHRGTFRTSRTLDGRAQFVLRFPVAEEPRR